MTTTPDTRSRTALVAAGLVAVTVVGLVLTFGVQRPPQLAVLAEGTGAEATGAEASGGVEVPRSRFATLGRHDTDTCLTVVEPHGATNRPWCTADGADLLRWDQDGIHVVTYGGGERTLLIDAADGTVLGRPQGEVALIDDGAAVSTERHGGQLVVRSADGTVLWRTDAPASYDVTQGWGSPDGRHVAMLDVTGRLLVVSTDGSADPRVWADGLASWASGTWELRAD